MRGIEVSPLTKLASDILSERENLSIKYDDNMIAQLMQGSSSVGGARAEEAVLYGLVDGIVG